jgi:hypothetical protein
MAPAHRPVGPWQKSAQIADGNWEEGPWIRFSRVPLAGGGTAQVDVLIDLGAPPGIIGIRIHGKQRRLNTEMFRALPLDALRRAAARARPLLIEHSTVGEVLPEVAQPVVEVWEMPPGSDEYLAEVYRIWKEARERGEPGNKAVEKATGLSESQAQKWVSAARKVHETSRTTRGNTKKGTTSR